MQYQILKQYIDDGLTQREIARACKLSHGSVKHQLKKYSLRTRFNPHKKGNSKYDLTGKICAGCGETNQDNFYKLKKCICKSCHNKECVEKNKQTKLYALAKLGGKCKKCGYDSCIGALDIHHLDPSKKDSNFKTHRGWSQKRLDAELEKCILLCCRCHREEHFEE